jgi:hypothetical protein
MFCFFLPLPDPYAWAYELQLKLCIVNALCTDASGQMQTGFTKNQGQC